MPITEYAQETIYQFGEGDIFIALVRQRDEPSETGIAFLPGDKGLIGREEPEHIGKITSELGCRLVFRFSNIESLNVLIEQAMELREKMRAAHQPQEDEK